MKTILIIEDNLEIRENTTEIMEFAGFRVLSAMNGKEGITMAGSSGPDLILCDIMMPDVSGYEVLKYLRSNPATASIPFIYVAAGGEKKDVTLAMEMGASRYILKPYDIKELIEAVERCLIDV